MKLKDLISPCTEEDFVKDVLGKKPYVFAASTYRKEFFGNIITWEQFSDYINNHRASAGLQVITPDGRKLCKEKSNLFSDKQPHWDFEERYQVSEVYKNWSLGGSIILTKASLLTPKISEIAKCIENTVLNSAADAHFYCSPSGGARSFPLHADEDDNYLVHAIGQVHWKVYRPGSKTDCVINKVLGPGDLLYIPKGVYHKAQPVTARISISIPVAIRPEIVPLTRNYCNFAKKSS